MPGVTTHTCEQCGKDISDSVLAADKNLIRIEFWYNVSGGKLVSPTPLKMYFDSFDHASKYIATLS